MTALRETEHGTREPSRRGRAWTFVGAGLAVAVVAVALGAKWSESRTESSLLRAELAQVYVEAEALRTRAVAAEERVAALEQRVTALGAERRKLLEQQRARPGGPGPRVKPGLAGSRASR